MLSFCLVFSVWLACFGFNIGAVQTLQYLDVAIGARANTIDLSVARVAGYPQSPIYFCQVVVASSTLITHIYNIICNILLNRHGFCLFSFFLILVASATALL